MGSKAQGIYEARVLEPDWLPSYRRKAFEMANLSGEYDGRCQSYMRLTETDKQAHDRVLSGMVAKRLRLEKRRGKNSILRSAKVVSTTGPRNNLILDQGLNKMLRSSGTINWATWSTYCAAGVGTTATFTDSGATTATTSGSSTTVTASGSFFTAAMVGQLIRFDSGEERYIASQSGTACVVTVAVNIAAPTLFCVWAVNQTGLASESKRSNTYLTGAGNCGSSVTGNVWSGKRTYDFSVEVGNVNYTELGWSDLSAAASNLNSRTLISGGTVSVLIGQQLRVIYTIAVTVTPNASTPGTYSITGWPIAPATTTDGDYMVCNMVSGTGMANINTNGGSVGNGDFPTSRISNAELRLTTGSALPSFGSSYSAGSTAAANTNAFLSYTDQNFYLDAQGIFNLATGNATNWRGVYFASNDGFVFVFDEAQTKAATHTLTIRARMTVGRTLVNP